MRLAVDQLGEDPDHLDLIEDQDDPGPAKRQPARPGGLPAETMRVENGIVRSNIRRSQVLHCTVAIAAAQCRP